MLFSAVLFMAENQLAQRAADVVAWQTEPTPANLSVLHKKNLEAGRKGLEVLEFLTVIC